MDRPKASNSAFVRAAALDIAPEFAAAWSALADCHMTRRRGIRDGTAVVGRHCRPVVGLAHLEAAAGIVAEARRMLDDLTTARVQRVVSAWGIGAVHASLRGIDEAYRWLELAVQETGSRLILLRVHPRLDPIESDARYWPLVRRVVSTMLDLASLGGRAPERPPADRRLGSERHRSSYRRN